MSRIRVDAPGSCAARAPARARSRSTMTTAAPAAEDALYMIQAAESELHDQPAAAAQHARCTSDDAVIELEAGWAGEEGGLRLEIAHFALQALTLGEGNIGRVGDDQVHRMWGD